MKNPNLFAFLIALVTALPGTIAALSAAWTGIHNRRTLHGIKDQINGTLEQQLDATKTAAFAAGKEQQRLNPEVHARATDPK